MTFGTEISFGTEMSYGAEGTMSLGKELSFGIEISICTGVAIAIEVSLGIEIPFGIELLFCKGNGRGSVFLRRAAHVETCTTAGSAGVRAEIVRSGVRVAILGKPNAGKSSLLNCLAQR